MVTVLGGHNTFVGAAQSVTQVLGDVHVGDWKSLSVALRSLGLEESDVDELQEALSADSKADDGFGPRVRAFLKGLPAKAGSASKVAGREAIGPIASALILKYLGLG